MSFMIVTMCFMRTYGLPVALSVGVLLIVVGCSSSAQPDTSPPAPAPSNTGLQTEPADTAGSVTTVPMGQPGESAGLKMTVNKVTTTSSLRYVQEGKTVKPPAGGKFVLVETTGFNGTKAGIDLTCGFPVKADVKDSEGREFEGANDIDKYELKGNPGCNDDVQPGFPFKMTWAYMVPVSATVTEFNWMSISPDLERGPTITVPLTVS